MYCRNQISSMVLLMNPLAQVMTQVSPLGVAVVHFVSAVTYFTE